MHAHEIEKRLLDLKSAKSLIESVIYDLDCSGADLTDLEELIQEAQEAVAEIENILKRQN